MKYSTEVTRGRTTAFHHGIKSAGAAHLLTDYFRGDPKLTTGCYAHKIRSSDFSNFGLQ